MAASDYRKHPFYRLALRILKEPRHRIRLYCHQRCLRGLTDLQQFYEYVRQVDYQPFRYFEENSAKKRLEFTAVVQALAIDLRGYKVLDIGPGFGDAMDICRERGASEVDFIDNDPFFFHFNRLKKYGDARYLSCVNGLPRLPKNRYDLIWLKGSINAEHFIRKGLFTLHRSSIDTWLGRLEALAAPDCHVIITPLWRNDSVKRDIEDVHDNECTAGFLRNGYQILPPVEHFCAELGYPIAFYKGVGLRKNHPALVERVAA